VFCGKLTPVIPSIFTSVGYFKEWIDEAVKKLIDGNVLHHSKLPNSSFTRKLYLILKKFQKFAC
jgi:hypothetical protein